jgi:hypothetical protein
LDLATLVAVTAGGSGRRSKPDEYMSLKRVARKARVPKSGIW